MYSQEMQEARRAAGWREQYAMKNGHKTVTYVNGEKCFKFTYSVHNPYQDANGAMYNTVQKRWVN